MLAEPSSRADVCRHTTNQTTSRRQQLCQQQQQHSRPPRQRLKCQQESTTAGLTARLNIKQTIVTMVVSAFASSRISSANVLKAGTVKSVAKRCSMAAIQRIDQSTTIRMSLSFTRSSVMRSMRETTAYMANVIVSRRRVRTSQARNRNISASVNVALRENVVKIASEVTKSRVVVEPSPKIMQHVSFLTNSNEESLASFSNPPNIAGATGNDKLIPLDKFTHKSKTNRFIRQID